MDKYFYCYSYPLKEFLIQHGINPIFNSIHEKTQKKFWVFGGTEQLNELLEQWRLNKR